MAVFGDGPSVQLAALGEDAVPTGALLLAAALSASPLSSGNLAT
jgi:hypothetical protein